MALHDNKFVRWLVTLAKNSPWLFMAAGIHVIAGAVLSVIYLHSELTKGNVRDTEIGIAASKPIEAPPIQPEEQIDRKKIPDNDVEAELVTMEEQQTFVPTETKEEEDLHMDIGDPTGAEDGDAGETGGTAIGVGIGAGHYGTGQVSSFASRRVSRTGRGKKGRTPKGVTVATEEAVLEGLCWLIRHQNPDGSWGSDTLVNQCNPKTPCIQPEVKASSNFNEGLTGLALLAFLGQGLDHQSKIDIVDRAMGKKHKAGEVVKKGIKWLIDHQKEDGSFSAKLPFLYNEALATMALSECYGLSRNRELKRPAQKAVDFLVKAQKTNYQNELTGWRYGSRDWLETERAAGRLTIDESAYLKQLYDVDISVTTWVIMALKSARMSGLDVPDDCMLGGLRYAQSVTGKDGLVGYQTAAMAGEKISGVGDQFTYHTGTMTALGMLVRTFVQHDLEDTFLEDGARHILKDLPEVSKDKLSVDYYYWYYATLALNQFDGPDSPRKNAGKYWEPWNKALLDSILPLQNKTKERDVCSRGGWLENDRWSHSGHAIYNTAINVLTLEVYYRYENAFGVGSSEENAQGSVKPK